jgi:S-formylglutathione hydrolase FrmB
MIADFSSKRLFALMVVLVFALPVFGAKVDTLSTYSALMKKKINSVVIVPESYNKGTQYPVVYLLHGYSDRYSKWVNTVPTIKDQADRLNMIIVCPDGNYSSWYFDSPIDSEWQYESYITKELVPDIDERYKTIKDRKGRAITGLSMGGHGALYLAIKHQDLFAAAGSMSGGVDLRPFPDSWSIKERLGSYDQFPDRWSANSVIEMTHLIKPGNLALIIDCGKDDFFYRVNVALHDKLMYQNVDHDFVIRPGEHNWVYWANSITFQLLYFSNFFNKI